MYLSDMTLPQIHAAIAAERKRQAAKYGKEHAWGYGDCSSLQVSPVVKLAVLNKQCGDVAKALLKQHKSLRRELVQVAAVAQAWLEGL